MSAPVIACLGLRGGTGKTTLVYHLAWMFADLGVRVVAADLDHQCSLTERFVGLEAAAALAANGETLHASLRGFKSGLDGLAAPHLVRPDELIALLAGDIALLELDAALADASRPSTTGELRGGELPGALRWAFDAAAREHAARIVLLDLAPSFDSISRAALAAADAFIMPIVPDALAVRALRVTGELLDRWRVERRSQRVALHGIPVTLPPDGPKTLGYVVQMIRTSAGLPAPHAQRSMTDIPIEFARSIAKSPGATPPSPSADESCLGIITAFHGLFAMAAEARKPIFHLRPADGAVGSLMQVMPRARGEFESLARKIATRLGIPLGEALS